MSNNALVQELLILYKGIASHNFIIEDITTAVTVQTRLTVPKLLTSKSKLQVSTTEIFS